MSQDKVQTSVTMTLPLLCRPDLLVVVGLGLLPRNNEGVMLIYQS